MHFVECPACSMRGLPSVADWAAAVEWNREHYTAAFPLEKFPYFELRATDLRATRLRLNVIRGELERAVKASRGRSAWPHEAPHPNEYLQAMLAWSIAAQTLVKQHSRHRQAAFEGRCCANAGAERVQGRRGDDS